MKQKPRIGINGFGRIGRAIFRINQDANIFDIPIINEINPDNKNIAYLLKYDTTYGRANFHINNNNNSLLVDDDIITLYHEEKIANVPWDESDIDFVIDCSGQHQNLMEIDKNTSNVKNIVITNIPDGVDHSIVIGCNEESLDPINNFIISSSICDAIAGAPIFNIINKNYNIVNGSMITLHPWLGYQNLLDGNSIPFWALHPDSKPISKDSFHHYALGRSAPMNIIVKPTSAFKAIAKTIPKLKNKILSHSYRIPTSIVSASTIMLNIEKKVKKESIVRLFKDIEKNQKYNIIKNSEEPLTAIDFRQEEFSTVIDHRWTSINNRKLLKMHYWYDNEWGYSSRVLDLIKEISKYYD